MKTLSHSLLKNNIYILEYGTLLQSQFLLK
jgi:hypothetical protein